MKTMLWIFGAGLAASLLWAAQPSPTPGDGHVPPADVTQAFQKLERDWADAVKRRETETINRLQADEFEFVGPNGEIWTKTRALEFIKGGNLEIVSFELSEFNVRLYGDTAVVTFRASWNASSGDTDVSGPQRMTDVFVKRDGRWLCVASQTTRIQ